MYASDKQAAYAYLKSLGPNAIRTTADKLTSLAARARSDEPSTLLATVVRGGSETEQLEDLRDRARSMFQRTRSSRQAKPQRCLLINGYVDECIERLQLARLAN